MLDSKNFIELINNVLVEQNKTIEDLFADKVVSPNTFYKYRHRYPSLLTLIKIANYLQMSIDYIFELNNINTFSKDYSYNAGIFYSNLSALIASKNLSGRQFCNELNYSRDNLARWKKGIVPSVINIIEIAQYFDCLVDDLLL